MLLGWTLAVTKYISNILFLSSLQFILTDYLQIIYLFLVSLASKEFSQAMIWKTRPFSPTQHSILFIYCEQNYQQVGYLSDGLDCV